MSLALFYRMIVHYHNKILRVVNQSFDNFIRSGVACRFCADVASYRKGNSRRNSGDHVTRWACDLKISSSKIIHRIATHKVSIVLTDVPD